MEEKLDGDQVIVEIQGGENKSNSSDPNVKILDFDPTPPPNDNIQAVQLDQDQGLRSRKRFTDTQIPENNLFTTSQQFNEAESPKLTHPITPRVEPDEDEDEDDDIYCTEVTKVKKTRKLYKKVKVLFSIKFSLSIVTILVLILSKTIDKLENIEILSLDLWKWCVFILAILCGRFISGWFTSAILLLIEKQFLLKKKVQYFIHSLRKSLRVFIWFALILLTWCLLINKDVDKSKHKPKVIKYITKGIASTLVISGIWILRTLFLKIINSSIYVSRYFDRIQEHIYGYDVLQTLLRPPLIRSSESNNGYESDTTTKEGEEKKKKKVIDRRKIRKLNPNSVSVWTMRELIKIVMDSELHSDINSRWFAKRTSLSAFKNVAKRGNKYIKEDDFLCFMHEDEVMEVLQMIEGAEGIGKITKKSFKNWVVNLHENHIRLKCSLIDTKSAVKELNKFVTVITVFVLIIIWLIITKIATTEVLLFISSQFLLAVFTFGATAKSAFDSIIFVFVKHPFDIGDRCVIDGVQVVIEEVNILTTVVLRYDNEKIYYPNSVLSTKSISNFNRSPDMSDCVDFDLDVCTSEEMIQVLTARIQQYVNEKPEFWRPSPIVRAREIQDVNKMKMSLYVTHTMNFQNYEEKCNRLSKLVVQLKIIFKDLDIKYHFISPRNGILGVE